MQHHAMVRDELMVNLRKFHSAVERTIQQIEGEVRLVLPDIGDVEGTAEGHADTRTHKRTHPDTHK